MSNLIYMRVWLDDCRPAPQGWVWVKTVEEAKEILLSHPVLEMSLDHDLGVGPPCELCVGTTEGYYTAACPGGDGGCECGCHAPLPSGYDLVKWMAESGRWPKKEPRVHSMNPVGRASMLGTIKRYYRR